MGVITKPNPIPISIEATNNIGDDWIKMSPTPTPINVVPPIAQELLSSFFVVMIFYFRKLTLQYKPNIKFIQ